MEEARRNYRHEKEAEGRVFREGDTVNYPDRVYRAVRERPLLILHLLKIDAAGESPATNSQPVVAWSLSFPKTRTDEQRVKYVVNTTWLRENFGDEMDEDEMEGDDV